MQVKAVYIDQPPDKTQICTCTSPGQPSRYSRCESCQLNHPTHYLYQHMKEVLQTKIRYQPIPCSACTTWITPKRHGHHRDQVKALRLINPYDRGQFLFCCPKCATRSQVTRVRRSINHYLSVYYWWTHLPGLIQHKIDRYFTHSKPHYHKLNKVI